MGIFTKVFDTPTSLGPSKNMWKVPIPIDIQFIHIPKTGGQSIVKLLRDDQWDHSDWTGHDTRDLWLEYAWHCFYHFTIVRDPIERIKSEMRCGGTYKDKAYYNSKNKFDPNICVTKWLNENRGQRDSRGNHIRPQIDFVNPQIDTEVDIFYFEDPTHRDQIKRIFQIFDNYPHEVGREYNPQVDYSLSEATEEMLRDYYKDDYETFYPSDTIDYQKFRRNPTHEDQKRIVTTADAEDTEGSIIYNAQEKRRKLMGEW